MLDKISKILAIIGVALAVLLYFTKNEVLIPFILIILTLAFLSRAYVNREDEKAMIFYVFLSVITVVSLFKEFF